MCCPLIFALGLNLNVVEPEPDPEVDPPPEDEPHALRTSAAQTVRVRKTPDTVQFLLGTIRVPLLSVCYRLDSPLQNDRPAQVPRLIRVEPTGLGERYRRALDGHQLDHRVATALDDLGTCIGRIVQHRPIDWTDSPDQRAGRCRADGTVPVLHRRIGLRPRASCLP